MHLADYRNLNINPSNNLVWRRNNLFDSHYYQDVWHNCVVLNGVYETVEINGILIKTCKLTADTWEISHLTIVGDLEVNDIQSGYVWVGVGPYNGIFKAIDYSQKFFYRLRNYSVPRTIGDFDIITP